MCVLNIYIDLVVGGYMDQAVVVLRYINMSHLPECMYSCIDTAIA